MKLNIAVVLLTLGLAAASSAGQARSTIDEIHMRATVQDVVLLTDFSGKVILLFGEEAKKGKTYDFSVQREIKHGKTRYCGLKVEKVQTAPVVSSAR
jgi:hypothetical protein